ncbi:MAG: hypothetical protein JSV01_06345 [Desulfobacterales bacterium]|nr:MAG: hypothetical protein JSV01_06345 [Desulfobacterales bacterium]
MGEAGFILDKQAEMLFQQIGGVDFGKETSLDKALSEEEKKLNACRGLLGELVHLLATCLENVHLVKDTKERKRFLHEFLGVLRRLGQMPGHDGKILIRFRGLKTGTATSEKIDYVVLFGNILFDMATVAAMVKNLEDFSTDFQTQLTKGFQVFSEHGINTLFLQIPDESPASSKAMWVALYILSRCSQGLNTAPSALVEKTQPETSLPLIHDEQDQPDLNLTMLAGVNAIKAETMKALVRKVDTLMRRPEYEASEEQFASVYNAILGIKAIRKKLAPPPIEVNNIKWLMVDNEEEVVSKRKTEVARIVIGRFGTSPQDTARIMGSVYGDDFQEIDSQNLGERLHLASNLLTSIEETDNGQPVMEEVLDSVEKRLDQVSDDTYDNLEVDGEVIKAKHGETETTIGRIHSKLKGLVSFFKARSTIKNKMKNLADRGINFDEQDYKVIAKDFGISADEARNLIETFKSCFDDEGSFLRDAFGRNIPQFAKYGKKIFEFLWHYFKQMSERKDRIALLSCLQILIPRLKQPQGILRALVADFSNDTESITFTDRSALVLVTLLISNYTKGDHKDIEITPEDVLTIKDLDVKIVAVTSKLIDRNQEKFFKKFRTIHRQLAEALVRPPAQGEPLSLRDIFLLERELQIFLSLIGGNTARTLIRNAAEIYGNPKQGVYWFRESERFLPSLLQLLKISIRGLAREGDSRDLSLLEQIRAREGDFLQIVGETGHQEHLKRAMECAKVSIERIVEMENEDKKATNPLKGVRIK